jgi:RecB family exonuclease
MTTISEGLAQIAAARSGDPLAPVTVIVPSHLAGLQLRRRLARLAPYAGVRFETLPRLAEIVAAGHLAASGRKPLARPIGDFVCEQVAAASPGALHRIAHLPGYARVLRNAFRRLRRGGLRMPDDLAGFDPPRRLAEVIELYWRFREQTARYYDEEDLLDAAAEVVAAGKAGFQREIGAVFAVPPLPRSAGGLGLLAALRGAATDYVELDDAASIAEQRFVLAPDPASEAREAVREVIAALDAGVPKREVAVFYSTKSYGPLLREALAAANIPASPMPGRPLIETAIGRAVRLLIGLAGERYGRAAVLDFLSLAPLRQTIPGRNDARLAPRPAEWDRLSRDAGITRGIERWREGLEAYRKARIAALDDPTNPPSEGRGRYLNFEIDAAANLEAAIEGLYGRVEPLRARRPAPEFIAAFKAVVADYLDRDAAGYDEVLAEIDQLGTIGDLGGSFDLDGFAAALTANLEIANVRERTEGFEEGVLVANYRAAAGLSFQHAVLCGAFEGALPGDAIGEALLDDREWASLRTRLPLIEDFALRSERGREAVARAVASARETLVWSSPRNEPGGRHDYYPAPAMVREAYRRDATLVTASDLRAATTRDWLRRAASPMAAMLRGGVVDQAEARLRRAILDRQQGWEPGSPVDAAVEMLRARRSGRFTEWDGYIGAIDDPRLRLDRTVSPTALEHYATCGFRYFGRSVLLIDSIDEPEEREVMDPLTRGSLVHRVLERFFGEAREQGRPAPGEAWGPADFERVRELVEQEFNIVKAQGLTGRDVYAGHDLANLITDLETFLVRDSVFRAETGAVPVELEVRIPESEIAGLRIGGYADRIDRTPDGRRAWVIDYKTGRKDDSSKPEDPFAGGTKLQLPTYLRGAGTPEATAVYWFITRRGGFEQVQYEASPENDARFAATLGAIAAGIRSGAFPAVPGEEDNLHGFTNCGYCEFDRICSRRRDLELDGKGADAAIAPWYGVGMTARNEAAP